MPPPEPVSTAVRQRVMRLLKQGRITQAEAADLAGVTRQRIGQWTFKAGFDPLEARSNYVRTMARNAGLPRNASL